LTIFDAYLALVEFLEMFERMFMRYVVMVKLDKKSLITKEVLNDMHPSKAVIQFAEEDLL
jgi:hypothetical protein